jgi:hypothetical protein
MVSIIFTLFLNVAPVTFSLHLPVPSQSEYCGENSLDGLRVIRHHCLDLFVSKK